VAVWRIIKEGASPMQHVADLCNESHDPCHMHDSIFPTEFPHFTLSLTAEDWNIAEKSGRWNLQDALRTLYFEFFTQPLFYIIVDDTNNKIKVIFKQQSQT
jgi:hypothetical protein